MHSAMDGVLDLAQSIVLVHSPAIDVALGASATLKGPFDPTSRKAIYNEFNVSDRSQHWWHATHSQNKDSRDSELPDQEAVGPPSKRVSAQWRDWTAAVHLFPGAQAR
jgi:hypothetical protein